MMNTTLKFVIMMVEIVVCLALTLNIVWIVSAMRRVWLIAIWHVSNIIGLN